MERKIASSVLALVLGLSAVAYTQQGGFGGAQGGGFGGQQGGKLRGGQGQLSGQMDGSYQSIDSLISSYLNGEEVKCILTPGEFCEWTLNLKAGQVIVGEARSDAFDPAIEMVDDKGKVLASNDDRYPGDQRPLLLWRCTKDGAYAFHMRCFHDKSGGQAFVRFHKYDSVDLSEEEKVEKQLDTRAPFLLRIPMKAGQIKEIVADFGGQHHYLPFRVGQMIAPDGLPDIGLAKQIQPAIRNSTFMAPVKGDYYALASPEGGGEGTGTVHVGTREIVPTKLVREGNGYNAKAPTNLPALWELNVKAGEFLEASTPDLNLNCRFVLAEEPDIAKYDMAKTETNPFVPQPNRQPLAGAFDLFPKRARDGRSIVFVARRDAKLWLASNGANRATKQFTLRVEPAASDFALDKATTGKLRIADTDYWAFDAKAGDVMNLNSGSSGFSEMILVRDPDLEEIRHYEAGLDQTSEDWRMIVEKPGRYLVAVSCFGNGGGGDYSLSRKVFHAKEFGLTSPARAEISEGDVQIWKFTATPQKPLLVHWSSTAWSYDIAIYDEKGRQADFQREAIDGHNTYGILKVTEPQTYVIVLTGGHGKANYSIELGGIPGYSAANQRSKSADK